MSNPAPQPSWLPLALAASAAAALIGLVMFGREHSFGLPVMLGGGTLAAMAAVALVSGGRSPEEPSAALPVAWRTFILVDLAGFVAFLAAWFYVVAQADHWPPAGTPPIEPAAPAVATILLALSTALPEIARRSLASGRRVLYRATIASATLIGLTVIAISSWHTARMASGFGLTGDVNILSALWWYSALLLIAHLVCGVLLLINSAFAAEPQSLVRARLFWKLTAALAVVILLVVHLGGIR